MPPFARPRKAVLLGGVALAAALVVPAVFARLGAVPANTAPRRSRSRRRSATR
jgi:hypothetical protein